MQNDSSMFIGAILGILATVTVYYIAKPRISDAELYRFCMVRGIALQDCLIPKEHYTKEL